MIRDMFLDQLDQSERLIFHGRENKKLMGKRYVPFGQQFETSLLLGKLLSMRADGIVFPPNISELVPIHPSSSKGIPE